MTQTEDELWQIFRDNGLPLRGAGASKQKFRSDRSLIMGNAHVWFWKRDDGGGVHLLLQKRSLAKDVKPGWYHISSGGHINVGESAVEAAVRETSEETGLELDPELLHFVGTMRIVDWAPNDLAHVYLYQLSGHESFSLLDGEVESMDWYPLTEVETMLQSPDDHRIVNQGEMYFSTLITALKHQDEASRSRIESHQ